MVTTPELRADFVSATRGSDRSVIAFLAIILGERVDIDHFVVVSTPLKIIQQAAHRVSVKTLVRRTFAEDHVWLRTADELEVHTSRLALVQAARLRPRFLARDGVV